MADAIEVRRFDTPDEALDMKDAGGIKIIGMTSTGTTGMQAIFEPGWTWEKDEKPLLGNPDTKPSRNSWLLLILPVAASSMSSLSRAGSRMMPVNVFVSSASVWSALGSSSETVAAMCNANMARSRSR